MWVKRDGAFYLLEQLEFSRVVVIEDWKKRLPPLSSAPYATYTMLNKLCLMFNRSKI